MGSAPRILVTGFSLFPGAPLNPTALLIEELGKHPEDLARFGEVFLDILDVDYRRLPERLAELGQDFRADIAVHFGLSAEAKGFELERTARNVFGRKPDNSGHVPVQTLILPDGGAIATRLPLVAVKAALEAKGLPVAFSDDAGDYLCNYLFYLSCGNHCAGFAPEISGFIHVPPLREASDGFDPADGRLSLEQLREGAETVLAVCTADWHSRRGR